MKWTPTVQLAPGKLTKPSSTAIVIVIMPTCNISKHEKMGNSLRIVKNNAQSKSKRKNKKKPKKQNHKILEFMLKQ